MRTRPALTAVRFTDAPHLPLLVVGPSLGTSVRALWGACAVVLADRFDVVGWDLPGHGGSRATTDAFDIADLADAVIDLVDDVQSRRGAPRAAFTYAGDSVGGAVGLQLLLDHPHRLAAAAVVCSGARIGDPTAWAERAQTVRTSGTAAVVEGSRSRWFAPGFVDREPAVADALLASLREADGASYALVCEALARFDVRDRLDLVTVPVLAVAGAMDAVCPPSSAEAIADGVRHGRAVTLDGVGHLAPAEAPAEVARLVHDLASRTVVANGLQQAFDAGLRVRREVLGDAHVDRAQAATTAFGSDFQELITAYAWGTIWTRPGLDRRSRSMITLTALVARGHHEELALHVRAARTNGLTNQEIEEVLLQSAIYCGVPDANAAFRIARRVLDELDGRD